MEDITKPAIQRLAYKAGVKSLSGSTYEAIRKILMTHLQKVIDASIVFASFSRRKTIQKRDVMEALKVLDHPVGFENNRQVTRQITTKSGQSIKRIVAQKNQTLMKHCKIYHTNQKMQVGGSLIEEDNETYQEGYDPEEVDIAFDVNHRLHYDPYNSDNDSYNENLVDEDIDYDAIGDTSGNTSGSSVFPNFVDTWDDPLVFGQTGGTRRNKPGVVALRKIKYYQKQPGHCLNIPKAPFHRLIKAIVKAIDITGRISPEAVMVIQLETENYLIDLLSAANLQAIHANRVRVQPQDLQMAHQY